MNRRRAKLLNGTDGFCLTELMCAMAIGGVVVMVAFETLHRMDGKFRRQQQEVSAVQDARLGLAVWEQDVRAALSDEAGGGSAMIQADPAAMRFVANVSGLVTRVTVGAAPGQQQLSVEDGRGWPEGKRIRLCPSTRCLDGQLGRDGQKGQLLLEAPLTEAVPAGVEVSVVNDVRYYTAPDTNGTLKLMRQVDGGANSVVGDLHDIQFRYRTRQGNVTTNSASVAVVEMELLVGDARRSFRQQVALRS